MKAEEFSRLRRKMKLTQAELARALGVSRAAVSRWESGKRHIDSVLALAMDCLAKRQTEKGRRKHGKRRASLEAR
jgi:transcriptional regulator with XRE-family HTH domain